MPFAVLPGGGRPRLPTLVKAARGTLARGRNPNANEPKIGAYTIPLAPKGMGEEERDAWEELRAVVNPLRIASKTDMSAFRVLVRAKAVERIAFKALIEHGIAEEGERMARPRPEAAIFASAQKLVWYGLSRFGVTPADRSRVRVGDDDREEKDPDSEFG